MRYLTPFLRRDLADKLVLLSGPRQVGKSTLAKSLLDERGVYLNWDIRSHKRVIKDVAWPKDASLVVLDEFHKHPRWKNLLKGVIDEFQNRPPLLVTGSERLEILRKGGDALTGRTYHYRLHPIDVDEASRFTPDLDPQARVSRLLKTGGFPEAYLRPENAERLRDDRFDIVVREDLRDLSRTSAVQAIGLLVELLRERVGSKVSFSNLAEDLSVSMPTVKSWVGLLERLYLVFTVPPYARGLARSLRKEPKVYFHDCAAAFDEAGARLENLVACTLLKRCHLEQDTTGRKLKLFYFRDRDRREVDFVVTEGPRVKWCIEVKQEDADLHRSLAYLCERLRPAQGLQLVRELSRPREIGGIKIIPLAKWLDDLSRPEESVSP
jgi:predicted AAA+ superfamily ATPase